MKPHVIAFYLPQFYPFPENDEWWGKGFTEWTNVGKAKPMFRGHNQPRVPTELGYYDLRLPIIREQQAELAKEAGVTAFCYWHYWFGNGRRLLADVFNEVLASGKPNFPFCLGWANHSWMAKNWNADGTTKERILIEQTYPGVEDAKMHFDFLLKAFKDKRYVKIDGMPLLYIFDAKHLPQIYISLFKQWTIEAGFPGLLLVANCHENYRDKKEFITKGYDFVSYQRLSGKFLKKRYFRGQVRLFRYWDKFKAFFTNNPPFLEDYNDAYPNFILESDKANDVIPAIIPQWDHSPRSGRNGVIMKNSNPQAFYKHVKIALNTIKDKPGNRQILFLRSWNEWGEGNFMEPDITYGRGFINALRKALDEYEHNNEIS